jgi:hypothetical protein
MSGPYQRGSRTEDRQHGQRPPGRRPIESNTLDDPTRQEDTGRDQADDGGRLDD